GAMDAVSAIGYRLAGRGGFPLANEAADLFFQGVNKLPWVTLTLADGLKGGLPDRGHVRFADGCRQRCNQRLARVGGADKPAVAVKVVAAERGADDGGSGGLGAQPVGFPQGFAQVRIADEAGDVGNRR